jgi:hypothetical protein
MEQTTEHAYDTAMAHVERGHTVVCVPGDDEDGPFVLTIWAPVDDDLSRSYVYDDSHKVRASYMAGLGIVAHRKVRELA